MADQVPHFPELGFYGLAGHSEDPDDLIPAEWLAAHISGNALCCAEQVRDQFAATGVDSIIMHGVNPDQLADVTAAYAEVRHTDMPVLPANSGWMN